MLVLLGAPVSWTPPFKLPDIDMCRDAVSVAMQPENGCETLISHRCCFGNFPHVEYIEAIENVGSVGVGSFHTSPIKLLQVLFSLWERYWRTCGRLPTYIHTTHL